MLPKLKMGSCSAIYNPSSPDSESVADVRLPQDLITEILLYLPVKSLVRFKCVSKPWLSLIENPRFMKSHSSNSSRKGQLFNHQLLFVGKTCMKLCSLSAALHNPSTNVSDIEYPFPNHQGFVRIVGIVNGLVCLFVDANDLYICNPILKQFKRLPSYSCGLLDADIVHGFGYDESNDDYKVVKVSHVCGGVFQHNPDVKVYSLRSDTWRTIQGFEGANCFDEGTYTNGKILWTSISPLYRALGSGKKWIIVSLDMASDKYEEVQGPCYETCPYYCVVGSFGGSLSMLCCHFHSSELWVMDEHGVDNSWSKVFSLPYEARFHVPRSMSYSLTKVVCILGDGEIVLEDTSGLIVYHTKTKDFRNIQLGGGLYRDFFAYVESFVAL